MSETRVRIGGRPPGQDVEVIRINGSDPTFRIGIEALEQRLSGAADDLLLDLLDVAGSVFAADRRIGRGADTRPGFGAAWRRVLDFTIPVRQPNVWQRPDVITSLTDLVRFLTDDVVTFDFIDGSADLKTSRYSSLFRPEDLMGKIDAVILFSGGLDSLTGAMETLASTTDRVALVTHISAQKIMPHQVRLAKEIIDRFGRRVVHVPIRATGVGEQARSETQRSRSLLFVAFGYLVARMLNARRIDLFENGIVSLNLPISPQVVGTMATRTTHPLTMDLLRRFLTAIGNTDITLDNRYAWLTKTEVLQHLAQADGTALIAESVSCTSVRDRDILHTHCGACSQCLDRRFAIMSAGLEMHEPPEMYETEVVTGPRTTSLSQTTALDWTRHAVNLADVDVSTLAADHAGELQRIARGYPELEVGEVLRRYHTMLNRHGAQVKEVMNRAIRERAEDISNRLLPPESLLAMFVHHQTGGISLLAQTDLAPASEVTLFEPDGDADDFEIFPLKVRFSIEGGKAVVAVRNLGRVKGASADVPHALLPQFRQDILAGLEARDHRALHARDLANAALNRHLSEEAIRRLVGRCRDALTTSYFAVLQEKPPRHLLIETVPGRGYRLDPTIRVVDAPK